MTHAFLGLGSNVGERRTFCRRAVSELDATGGVGVVSCSSLYETSPVGGPPQRSFVNMVCKIDTDLDPHVLLERCKAIEHRLGREPTEMRWGPRVIDIDILTFGDEKLNEPGLEVPHPRLTERRFVLIPLLEIEPDAADPWGQRYSDWLDDTEGDVVRLEAF
jgi:2-amino-4-hydroxy-6-hydroxymethyldihydropteridine diphosphokinase